jgi:signal transduction histidine kinase
MNRRNKVAWGIKWCLSSGTYWLLGILGISLAIPPGYASPVFPAAGFAMAVLLHGKHYWSSIWFSSFLLELWVANTHHPLNTTDIIVAIGMASGSALQAFTGSWLIKRVIHKGWHSLTDDRDILLCLGLAGPVACLISATISNSSLYAAHIINANELMSGWLHWWLGDALGVLVMLPLCLTFFNWRTALWRGRLLTLSLPMLVVLSLVSGAVFIASMWETTKLHDTIKDYGENLSTRLDRRFVAHKTILASLRRLVEVTPNLNFTTFDYFTSITLHDNPDIFALSMNPYVLLSERQDFEAKMAKINESGHFEIKERNAQGQLVRAQPRPSYVPVGFIAPLTSNKAAVGYDIHSEPIRHAAIQHAINTRAPAMTAPIQLVQEQQKRIGVLILNPIFQRETNANKIATFAPLIGFAVAVIKVDEMVSIAISAVQNPDILFEIVDTEAPKERALLYTSDATRHSSDSDWAWQQTLTVANRHWLLTASPTAAYLQKNRQWTVPLVGSAGLMLASVLQILLLVITGRTAIVQRLVNQKTAELQVASHALEDQNAQLNAVFTLSPDGLIAMTSAGVITFINPAFYAITGIETTALLGETEHTLDTLLQQRAAFPEQYIPLSECVYNALTQVIKPISLVLLTPKPTVLQIIGMDNTVGSIARILYFRDITYETEVDRMKSEFITTAAHELRTPLSSIYGYAEILHAFPLTEKQQKDYQSIIYKQAKVMTDILTELLDLATLEARGEQELTLESISAQTVINNALANFKLPEQRSAPELNLPITDILLYGDQEKLHKVIHNVLSNAYKYSAAPSPVTLTLHSATSENVQYAKHLGISITDQGIGMTQEEISRVCERFYRADASGTLLGIGLGMSIVQSIILLHKGSLNISSEPAKGTTVTLWLPRIHIT